MKNKYIATKLNNGAKLYYVKNKINKSTCVDVLFNCGSRCDTIPGLAHFVEHMFFTGTKNLTKEEISKKYSKFISTNAYTNIREICFTGTIFSSELEEYLSTIATLITESTFTQTAVEKERKIINQEIAEYSDKYEEIAHAFNLYNLYQVESFKETSRTVGNIKSIAKITNKDIKKFVKTYFVSNNLEIYITSPLSLNKVKNAINKNLVSKLPQNANLPKLEVQFFDVADNNFYKTKKANIEKTYIRLNLTFKQDINDYVFEQKFLTVLNMINDASLGIDRYLRLKKSLVYYSYFNYWRLKQNGILSFYCNCQKQNVNEIIRTVASFIKTKLKDGFALEELKNNKRLYRHREMCKSPSMNGLIGKLYDYRWYNKIRDNKKLRKIRLNCTLDDCNSTFKNAITDAKISLSLFGDFDKETLPTKKELNELFNFSNIQPTKN